MSAKILSPASRTYRGKMTDPARWAVWDPRPGDILVCTPPKCGTTWTQTILAMLLHGGPDLPQKLPVLSPWVDADLGVSAEDVARALDAQPGRRVVKTHTPADGFPIWEGVTVIAVFRHPLDVFFSLRRHTSNMVSVEDDHPMRWDVSRSVRHFIDTDADPDDFDRDTLATLTKLFDRTVVSGRVPGETVFHYADMVADGRETVARLARAAGIEADSAIIDRVCEATAFGAMKANAADYAPVGGTGFWKSDANFFDAASSRKWEGQISNEDLTRYTRRLNDLVPDASARAWLEQGGTWPTSA
ncbi:MAG: sulfotransferase domain-containing protein [Pseudomonadota bacterium]